MKFTNEQEAIFKFVREGSGHGIIDAVAGAGKTTTIMECARHARGKSRLLFCAFNNSISREISRKFTERGMDTVTVRTIHSLGLRLLKQNLKFDRQHRIDDKKYLSLFKSEAIQERLNPFIQALIEIAGFSPEGGSAAAFAARNTAYKIQHRLLNINQKHRSCLNGPSEKKFEELVRHYGIFTPAEETSDTFKKELAIYYRMHRILLTAGNKLAAEQFLIDFTDMIYLPFIWKVESGIKYDWIFIDECQDLSKAQFAIAAKYGQAGSRILAVGDPRQSIYGFTGADAESFDRVKRMTKATQLPLTVCFRCPQAVIGLAKEIRPDITGAKQGDGIVEYLYPEEILQEVRPEDLVICRFRSPLLLLAFDLIEQDQKVNISEDEATEFLAELRNLFKPDERQGSIDRRYRSFKALREIVYDRNAWVIRQEAAKLNGEAKEAFLEQQENYLQRRLDFLARRHKKWAKSCRTINALLKKVETYLRAKKGAVKLSTIHRAKGLEDDRVFILDFDKLPFKRIHQLDWEHVQETNLKYVAVTRAAKALYLVIAPDLDLEEVRN